MCVCIDWVWCVWLSPTLGQMRVFSTAVLPFARQIELLICCVCVCVHACVCVCV